MSAIQWRGKLAERLAEVGRSTEAVALQRAALAKVGARSRIESLLLKEGLSEALWRHGELEESTTLMESDLKDLESNGPIPLLAGKLRKRAALCAWVPVGGKAANSAEHEGKCSEIDLLERAESVTASDSTFGGRSC